MFDFENLIAYQKARYINKKLQILIREKKLTSSLRDQLHRASISMVLNIAEGTGKIAKNDRKNFYAISRGSTYECASLLDIIYDLKYISENERKQCHNSLHEVSKLLSGLILSIK